MLGPAMSESCFVYRLGHLSPTVWGGFLLTASKAASDAPSARALSRIRASPKGPLDGNPVSLAAARRWRRRRMRPDEPAATPETAAPLFFRTSHRARQMFLHAFAPFGLPTDARTLFSFDGRDRRCLLQGAPTRCVRAPVPRSPSPRYTLISLNMCIYIYTGVYLQRLCV